MHCVLIHSMAFAWLKSVFLFAKNTRLYENRYRFFFTQCDSRLFAVLSRAQFVCLIRFKNETPLQGLMWKGTFLIISRSGLFTELAASRIEHPYKIETAKNSIKKTAWKNDVFALQYSKLFQSYRQGDRKNFCVSVGNDKSKISWS